MLRQRLVTAALAVLVTLGILWWGELPWRVMVLAGTLLCMVEFTAMSGLRWWATASWYGYAVVFLTEWFPGWHTWEGVGLIVGLAMLWPVFTRNRVPIHTISAVLLVALYIGYGGFGLAQLRSLPHGFAWVLILLLCVWATDTAAYFAGSRIRGPKLCPAISPQKTISGAVAGLAAGGLAGWVTGLVAFPQSTAWRCVLIGLVISVAGQLGDLAESAYKRSSGVKDSGKLLPGHGGILDRVDSLLFAAPLLYYLVIQGAMHWLH